MIDEPFTAARAWDSGGVRFLKQAGAADPRTGTNSRRHHSEISMFCPAGLGRQFTSNGAFT
jgi:hypothetical protein